MRLKTITREISFSTDSWSKMVNSMFARYLSEFSVDEINEIYGSHSETMHEAIMEAIAEESDIFSKASMYTETNAEALVVSLCSLKGVKYIDKDHRHAFNDLPDGKVRDFIMLPVKEDIVIIPDGCIWPTAGMVAASGTFIPDNEPDPMDYLKSVYTPSEIKRFAIEGLVKTKALFDSTVSMRVKYPDKGEFTLRYDGESMSLANHFGDIVFQENKSRKEFSKYLRTLRKAGQII